MLMDNEFGELVLDLATRLGRDERPGCAHAVVVLDKVWPLHGLIGVKVRPDTLMGEGTVHSSPPPNQVVGRCETGGLLKIREPSSGKSEIPRGTSCQDKYVLSLECHSYPSTERRG